MQDPPPQNSIAETNYSDEGPGASSGSPGLKPKSGRRAADGSSPSSEKGSALPETHLSPAPESNFSGKPTRQKLASRACETCISIKAKCELLPGRDPPKCRRCVRRNEKCEFTAPQRRGPKGRRKQENRSTSEREGQGRASWLEPAETPDAGSSRGSTDVTGSAAAFLLPVLPTAVGGEGFGPYMMIAAGQMPVQELATPQQPAIGFIQSSALGLPVMVNELAPLPDQNVINFCLLTVAEAVEWRVPILHPSKILRGGPISNLLLCTILISAPSSSWVSIPGLDTPERLKQWERNLYHRIKAEVLALLCAGPAQFTYEAVAALMMLRSFTNTKGMGKLADEFRRLGHHVARSGGLIMEEEVLSVDHIPSWQEAASTELSPLLAMPPSPPVLDVLRTHWIEYWSKQRAVTWFIDLRLRNQDVHRDLRDIVFLPLKALDRPALPGMATWIAASHPSFDPRLVSPSPNLKDLLEFVDMELDDPRYPLALARLSQELLHVHALPFWLHLVLRNRVDMFLIACRKAGLDTPAELNQYIESTNVETVAPELRALIDIRLYLEEVLRRVCDILPPQIKVALATGSAELIVSAYPPGTDVNQILNELPQFPLLLLLKLDLCTSLGFVFEVTTLSTNRETVMHIGDMLFHELVASPDMFKDVVNATRILDEWRHLHPLNHFKSQQNTLAARLACIHLMVTMSLRNMARAEPDAPGILSVLQESENFLELAFHVMKLWGERGKRNLALYLFFKKIVDEGVLDVTTLEKSQKVEWAPEAEGELEEIGPENATRVKLRDIMAAYQR